jgi:hypothetical protein
MKGFPPEIPLGNDLGTNGYPLLESVRVEPGIPSDIPGYDYPTSGSNPEPETCLALIDTGADTCSITANLKGKLDLLPQKGKISEGGYAGQTRDLDAYSILITLGGVFSCLVRVAAVMVPKKGYNYQIIIGCNVLQHCTLTYGTHSGEDRNFTLHVPRAMGMVLTAAGSMSA